MLKKQQQKSKKMANAPIFRLLHDNSHAYYEGWALWVVQPPYCGMNEK
jgi:hypothetical protein